MLSRAIEIDFQAIVALKISLNSDIPIRGSVVLSCFQGLLTGGAKTLEAVDLAGTVDFRIKILQLEWVLFCRRGFGLA